MPNKPTILTNTDNLKTMIVSDWHAAYNKKMGEVNGRTQEVSLGATLFVGDKEDNPAGIYDGTYVITFMYN